MITYLTSKDKVYIYKPCFIDFHSFNYKDTNLTSLDFYFVSNYLFHLFFLAGFKVPFQFEINYIIRPNFGHTHRENKAKSRLGTTYI